MCLIKGILAHYTVLLSQQPPAPPFGAMPGANGRVNGTSANSSTNIDNAEPSLEDVDTARTREITAKAVSGIMLLLLKWLKLSRESAAPSSSKTLADKVPGCRCTQVRVLDPASSGL